MILRYIPYVQTNFVLGLDCDMGDEPFELTKRFVDQTPGAFPAYSLLSAFGQAAPLNLELQRERPRAAVPVPLPRQQPRDERAAQELHAGRPSTTGSSTCASTRSPARAIGRRLAANDGFLTRSLNLVRAISSEGHGRIRHDSTVRGLLDTDRSVRSFFDGETATVPGVLPQPRQERARRSVGFAARRRRRARPQRIPEGGNRTVTGGGPQLAPCRGPRALRHSSSSRSSWSRRRS